MGPPLMRLERYLVVASLLMTLKCASEDDFAAGSKRTTPELITCRAAATMDENELELWKRIRASLHMTQALQNSEVLVARMLVLPTNFSEWQISVYLGDDGKASVGAAIAEQSVYQANHIEKQGRVILKENPDIGTPDNYRVSVQKDVAEAIGRVWSRVIHRSQLPKPQPWGTMDGTTYILSRWVQGEGEICGETHEPIAGSIPGRLTDIGKNLLKLARSDENKRKELISSLQKDLELIESQLNQSKDE